MSHQLSLLKDRRFGPLFGTMFLGAFNDNLFKTTFVVLVAYGVWDIGTLKPEILVALSAAIFILPYVLMAPLGGSLADKFDKAVIMRTLKIAEVLIVAGVIVGLWLQSLLILYIVLFAFGAHSALFSPSKFAIVPQQMRRDELIGANALLNTGSFVAILAGNVLGSLWGVDTQGHMIAFAVLLICAVAGYGFSLRIPYAAPPEPGLQLRWNLIADIGSNFKFARQQPPGVMVSLLAIAWFYFVGGTFLAQFPTYASQSLHVDHFTLSIFMALFTAGIGLGGMLNNVLLKSKVSARYVPISALGIAIFACDMFFATGFFKSGTAVLTFPQFIDSWHAWRVLIDVVMLSVCAGIYVVPLNAILQDLTAEKQRARVMSVSNVLDAVFILVASVLGIALFSAGFHVEELFLVEGIMTLAVAFYFLKNPRIFGVEHM